MDNTTPKVDHICPECNTNKPLNDYYINSGHTYRRDSWQNARYASVKIEKLTLEYIPKRKLI